MSKQALLFAVLMACLLAACGAAGPPASAVASNSPPHLKAHKTAHVSAAGTGGLQTVNLKLGNLKRYYLLYVPPGDTAKHPLPLVLAYSGVDDSAINTATLTGLLSEAEQQHNMIVAFPEGYDESWNDDAGNPPAEAAGVNDVAFTSTMLRRIETNYHVDMKHVVATGFSNGAILAELLGCRLASNLTLIAPVEGQLAPRFSNGCKPAMPISVYEIHATGDQTIPYSGGEFAGAGGPVVVLSAPASAKRWAAIDGCGAAASSSRVGGTILTEYKGCRDSVTVTLASIQGGSHEWPPGFAATLSSVITALPTKRSAVTP
jgi:polyhydroxybutyrate depolymerase